MPVAYVAHASSTRNNSTAAWTCAKPTGTTEGMLLVAFVATTEQVSSLVTSHGFTEFVDGGPAGGYPTTGGWESRHLYGFWKVADGSEPSSYTIDPSDSTPHSGSCGIFAVSDAWITEPIDGWIEWPDDFGDSLDTVKYSGASPVASFVLPSVDAPSPGCLLLAACGGVDNATWTTGSMTEAWDVKSTGSSACSSVGAYESVGEGATGTRTFTPNASTRGAGIICVIQGSSRRWWVGVAGWG